MLLITIRSMLDFRVVQTLVMIKAILELIYKNKLIMFRSMAEGEKPMFHKKLQISIMMENLTGKLLNTIALVLLALVLEHSLSNRREVSKYLKNMIMPKLIKLSRWISVIPHCHQQISAVVLLDSKIWKNLKV